MSCSRDPQPSNLEILMALDGKADPEVSMHVADCSDCRERAGQLFRLQTGLLQQLYRITCPSPLEIGEYHLGLLPAAQAAAIAQHVETCPDCADEHRLLVDFLPEPSLAPKLDLVAPVKKALRVLTARLIGGFFADDWTGQPASAPALAGIRGVADGPLMYEADGAQVMAEIVDDDAHPGRRVILGLLTGTFQADRFRAYLWQEATYRATAQVNTLGNFAIDNLPPGDYSLILSGPDLEIHLEDLPVRAN